MAAHGDVHLTEESDHLIAGNPELACHVVYAKLAQTVLLAGSTRARSMPLNGGRLDDGTDAFRELWIDDSDGGRRFPSYRGAELGRRGTLDHTNVLCAKHRNNLVQAVVRCVRCHDGEPELSTLRRVSYTFDPDNYEPSVHADSDQP